MKRQAKGKTGAFLRKNALKRPPNGVNERILDENASEMEFET